MAKSYEQLMKQIDTLSREAEAMRKKEVDGVIARIKEAIAVYGLTASDLGLGGARTGRRGAVRKAAPKRRPRASGKVKYRDEHGNVWGGRGPRPQWLREALASGRKLEDFAV